LNRREKGGLWRQFKGDSKEEGEGRVQPGIKETKMSVIFTRI